MTNSALTVLLFLGIYLLLIGCVIFLGYLLQRRKERSYVEGAQKIKCDELVVIIPFRNESTRIDKLLNSISASRISPKEYIFVDDHSTDNTAELIKGRLKEIPYRILEMDENENGKKIAIRKGISASESTFILSMDADVEFVADYFNHLESLTSADMYILPAILKAEKPFHYLFEVDLILVNAGNCGVSGLKRPILASGANLLYKRSSFNSMDKLERHAHMPSGDDIYLLRDFRDAGADIRLVTSTDVAIHTETPQSLKEFFHQRLRWVAKTGDVNDKLSTALAILQAVLTLGFFILLILLAIFSEWKWLLVLFALKTAADMLLFLPFFNRIKRMSSWLFIPVYELIFPLYMLTLLVMMYFFKPVWKGRKLDTNY